MLTHVFEPIRIGACEIPNRIVRTAHGTHFAHTELNDRFTAYHLARAKGGCGLTILEIASVHPSSVVTIRNFDDSIIAEYRKFMDVIRPHGMKVFQQLYHGGHNAPGLDGVAWSASDVPSPMGVVPLVMGRQEIDAVIAAFAAAAVRCKAGGLDGVELHGAHGYIFFQFLSRLTNHRDDDYGGSLDNRMRLLLETMRAVRAAVGPDFPVGVRLSTSEVPGGVTQEDVSAVIRALEAEALIDFVDLSLGDYYRMASMNAAMDMPTGYELPSAAPAGAVATVPRIVAGRFRTLEEADQVIRAGDADLVSMVRAQIADPDLVRKTREGKVEQVRPCIACNQGCIGSLFRGGVLGCLVNPAVGFEGQLSEDLIAPASRPGKVLVIGGGPAGMEAARIAALAGHQVILAEAAPTLGGKIAIARRAPFLATFGDIASWLEQEVYRLGVDVRLSTYMDEAAVRAENADHVIVATGSLPRSDGLQTMRPWEPVEGIGLPHVTTTSDLITNPPSSFGQSAVVLDEVGHYEAIAAVDLLMARGLRVTLVTRHAMLTPYVDSTQRTVPAMERFVQGDFRLMVRSQLTAIRQGAAHVQSIHGGPIEEVTADHVVTIHYEKPFCELFDALRDDHPSIHRIGDALSPRDAQAAIAEGRALAMALAR